ncbi:MAG: methionine--tRNA ligase [Treponema sp.]|uniref:methionine--tRNA ligase n=1 Tax=Treponema sp. TaxID=166 RepID=UPI00298E44BA|nr:methionine--tRNA ligase [Treponema sp.]MBR5934461.1 methionine--tRNA ligase [Treponema sp.]
MNRRLITAALPYVNNIPHLGNIIQSLSGDVFARFCRNRGYETLYVCGVDEYGTATETKALEEGKDPRSLCNHYYQEHTKIYKWFNINFDKFGRTSNPQCTEITQSLFTDLDKAGLIKEHVNKQLFCPNCNRFLADRYVDGTCPKCGSTKARGDQCDECGTLLDPIDLKDPKCHTCGATPEVKETKHLYIDLPSISPKLNEWMEKASVEGKWADNALSMTKAWIRDGLQERAITRDLKWGIPVPKEGYESKVFYVWFNAPIGYLSITKQLADELEKSGRKSFDWKSWWLPEESEEAKGKEKVDLFQFIGKDNIPFHTVIFPCTLLGSPHNWTKLHHMSSTEFLNYEDGKFSKSRGIGVFGSDAIESGIPADAWRFYIFYNRPEKQDYQFTWKDFMEKLNGELIGNLGNLVNRTLLFVNKYFDGVIPEAPVDEELWSQVRDLEKKATDYLEWAELKDAFHTMFEISDICNKKFQAAEPWKTRESDPESCKKLIHNLCYVIKDLMIMMNPYMPQYTQVIMSYFGKSIQETKVGTETKPGYTWANLGETEGLDKVGPTEVYFKPLDQKTMLAFREKFSGTQQKKAEKEAKKAEKKKEEQKPALTAEQQVEFFNKNINLTVAKIVDIKPNPEGEKLYIETLDDGSGTPRTIQSGLRMYLKEEELLGKHVIIAENLAPRTMRGVESRGMLLAGDYKDENGKECVEVLDAAWAAPGTKVILEGADVNASKKEQITGDEFFSVAIEAKDGFVQIAGKKLMADGKEIKTQKALNSEIG